MNLFYGDIQQYEWGVPYREDYRAAYGLIFRKQITPVFGLGWQLLNGKLHGTKIHDREGGTLNLMFDASVFEYNMHSFIDVSSLFAGYNPNRRLTVYSIAGLGFSNWKTELRDYKTGKLIRENGFSGKGPGKRTTEVVVPVGMGLRFNINDRIALNYEGTLRGVYSDILDATEGGFKYDIYSYSSLGLTYNLNSLSLISSDPGRKEARTQRQQSKLAERDLRQFESDVKYRRTRPEKSYERELKNYEREQMYYRQTQPQQERRRMEDPDEFRQKYARGDLPEVVEYDIVGVFDRDYSQQRPSFEQPLEVEVIELPPAATIISGARANEEKGKSRVLTDKTSAADWYITETTVVEKDQPRIQTVTPVSSVSGIMFGVQVLAKSERRADIPSFARRYNITRKIMEDTSSGIYRYVAGSFRNFSEASNYARILRDRGIYDAFVVAYQDGRRIPVSQALGR